MTQLTSEQLGILDHTANRASRPGQFCGDSEAMQGLVALGFMQSIGKASWCPDEFFQITQSGRDFLKTRKQLAKG